jgi:hypothetical protein
VLSKGAVDPVLQVLLQVQAPLIQVVHFVVYNTATLYRQDAVAPSPQEAIVDDLSSNTQPTGVFINSLVVDAIVDGFDVPFSGTVTITLPRLVDRLPGTERCVFWQYDQTEDGEFLPSGLWSSEGCRTVESTPLSLVCECDHLTSFAIMTDTSGQAHSSLALEIITYIGVAISVPCLLAVLVIYGIYPDLRDLSGVILMHLCANLAVALLLFVFGVDATDHADRCTGIAISLHFFWVAAFYWMLAAGVQLYRSYVKIFGAEDIRLHSTFALAVYLAAGLTVAITAGVQGSDGYAYPRC